MVMRELGLGGSAKAYTAVLTGIDVPSQTANVHFLLSDDLLESSSIGLGEASAFKGIVVIGGHNGLV